MMRLRAVSLRAVLFAVPTAFVAACLIAEPPTDPPRFPTFRPTILRDGCSPNPNLILGTFPDKFVVPVELVDPGKSFEWRVFYDYDPTTGSGLQSRAFGTSAFDPTTSERNIRLIETAPSPPSDLSTCHRIEIVVALKFIVSPTLSGQGQHTPDVVEEPDGTRRDVGSDSVTWFYAPNGDTRACGVFLADAGADAADAARDSSSDAADGGGG